MTYMNEIPLKVLEENVCASFITGSTSYGLTIETSDEDIKSIVVLPKKHLFQLGQEWETSVFHDPDTEFHSLKKFMSLANTQNPTVLEMLFTREEFIKKIDPIGLALRENAELFLSKNVYYSFGGYARQQLYRIKAGLDKLTQDDKIKHLKETVENILRTFDERFSVMNTGSFKLNDILQSEDEKLEFDMSIHFDSINIQHLSAMVTEVNNAQKSAFKMGTRNKKKAGKLEKHAMHLIRLLITGIEVLEQGKINVYRESDREFLLDVRNGKYSWEEIFEIVRELEEKLKIAYEKTKLLILTDSKKINSLYTELMLGKLG